MNPQTAASIFGESFEGVHMDTYAIKDGTVYYTTETVTNTRETYTQHEIKVVFSDGETVDIHNGSPEELTLWTTHLR